MTETAVRAREGIRDLSPDDLASVVRIDARRTGTRKMAYWRGVLREFLDAAHRGSRVGLAAQDGHRLAGYLLGEVRAFEFGSEPCGWIFAVAVDPDASHHGIGSALVAEACRRFRRQGIVTVRTMVRRNDVPLLAFFRANDFAGGSFVELERPVDDEG
jgi:ribosomal protein S18 acetylase RimI-like enzyme